MKGPEAGLNQTGPQVLKSLPIASLLVSQVKPLPPSGSGAIKRHCKALGCSYALHNITNKSKIRAAMSGLSALRGTQ